MLVLIRGFGFVTYAPSAFVYIMLFIGVIMLGVKVVKFLRNSVKDNQGVVDNVMGLLRMTLLVTGITMFVGSVLVLMQS